MEGPLVSDLVVVGTLVLQILAVVGLVMLFVAPNRASRWVGEHATLISFVLVFVSSLVSLYYENVLGFAACELCWYQRIFIMSQVVVLGIALYRRDVAALVYAVGLSMVGLLFAIYQVFVLPFLASSYICEPGEISCLEPYVTGFGYISIPVMSLTLLVALLVIWGLSVKTRRVV